jgi:hypothetical protein
MFEIFEDCIVSLIELSERISFIDEHSNFIIRCIERANIVIEANEFWR